MVAHSRGDGCLMRGDCQRGDRRHSCAGAGAAWVGNDERVSCGGGGGGGAAGHPTHQ